MSTKDIVLYRIISGRTNIKLGGLNYYILEPDSSILAESYFVYEAAYDEAYAKECFSDNQLQEFLIEQDVWTPHHDQIIKDLQKKIEDKKVFMYENNYKTKEVNRSRYELTCLEKEIGEMMSNKAKFNYLTCSHIAESARWDWIFSKCTYDENNKLAQEGSYELSAVNRLYSAKVISHDEIRDLSLYEPWRSVWTLSKLYKSQLFKREVIDYTRDQLSLCTYSQMYDNVYESHECPDESIIKDHDFLDGWFISQRRKREADKKVQKKVTKNSKINNSQEIFFMAETPEEAKIIYDMNSDAAKNIIKQRMSVLESKGTAQDIDFVDRQQQIQIQNANAMKAKHRGK